jgi:hypothetical protein
MSLQMAFQATQIEKLGAPAELVGSAHAEWKAEMPEQVLVRFASLAEDRRTDDLPLT